MCEDSATHVNSATNNIEQICAGAVLEYHNVWILSRLELIFIKNKISYTSIFRRK